MPMPHIRPVHAAAALMALALLASPACESSFDDDGHVTLDELEGRASPSASTNDSAATPSSSSSESKNSSSKSGSSGDDKDSGGSASSGDTNSAGAAASDIVGIRWLGMNVSSWPVTTTLHASVSNGRINMKYDKSKVWPSVDGVVGNCWAIVNINGTWYAGTFEYLRPGQTSKPTSVLDGSGGDHFKKQPLSSWRPQSGERFGLMVSGLCRGSSRNVSERSNICMVTWP